MRQLPHAKPIMMIIEGNQLRMEGVVSTHNTLLKVLVPSSSSGMSMVSAHIKYAVKPNNMRLPHLCNMPIHIATYNLVFHWYHVGTCTKPKPAYSHEIHSEPHSELSPQKYITMEQAPNPYIKKPFINANFTATPSVDNATDATAIAIQYILLLARPRPLGHSSPLGCSIIIGLASWFAAVIFVGLWVLDPCHDNGLCWSTVFAHSSFPMALLSWWYGAKWNKCAALCLV